MYAPLLSDADFVKLEQALVNRIRASNHSLGIVHTLLLPVAKVASLARFIEIGRLTNDKLAHLVDEEALPTGQKPQKSCHGEPLTD